MEEVHLDKLRERKDELLKQLQLAEQSLKDAQRVSPSATKEDTALPSTAKHADVSSGSSRPLTQFSTYRKLRGIKNLGVEFEQIMCTYYALKLAMEPSVSDFEMAAHRVSDGTFSDIGLEIRFANGTNRKILFQLKHRERKKIQFGDLIWKIYKSVSELRHTDESTVFIFFTNALLDIRDSGKQDEFYLEESHPRDVCFLANTEEGREHAIFEVKSRSVRQNFYLFTSQMSVESTKKKISIMLKDRLECEIFGSLMSYMSYWWSGRFILTKHDILAKAAELALSPYVKILTDRKCNQRTESLAQAIVNSPLTLVKEADEDIVENIWSNNNIRTDEELSKTKEKYDLKDYQEPAILWYMGKLPLVVTVNRSNDGIIKRVIRFLQEDIGNKMVVLCSSERIDDLEFQGALESLWDIIKQCEDKKYCSDIMRNFRVSLQGRGSITLEQLVSVDTEVAKLIGMKELLQMSQQEYLLVGNQRVEVPAPHIPRTIAPIFVSSEDVLNHRRSSRDTLLIIVNCHETFAAEFSRDINTMELSKYMSEDVNKKSADVVLLWTRDQCTVQFEAICDQSKKSNVYLLQSFDQIHFLLMLKKGKELKFEQKLTLDESEILNYCNNSVNVICAPPAMGKSTLMKVLYNALPCDSLAVYVSLVHFNGFLAESPDFDSVFDRFVQTDGTENGLFHQLKEHFWRRRKLYMFLDGLDEVSGQHVARVLHFVQHFSSRGLKIWLSSREHLREVICQTLYAVPIGIKKFDTIQQRMYISCKLEGRCRTDEIRKISNVIFSALGLVNLQNLLGTPLQLDIVTEIVLHDGANLDKRKLFKITQILKKFLEGKISFTWSKFFGTNQEQPLRYLKYMLESYEVPALKACLDEDHCERLLTDVHSNEGQHFLNELKTEGDKFGIIERVNAEDQAVFSHRTYAEYFASVWLSKHKNEILLFNEDIFTQRYKNLRLMFDILMAENRPLHLAVLYEDLDQIEDHIEDIADLDEGGRNVFHLAFSYGQSYDPLLVWQCEDLPRLETSQREAPCYVSMIERLLQRGRIPDEEDDLFGFDCIGYALQSRCLYPIEKILEKKLWTFDKLKAPLKVCYGEMALAYFSARFGFPNLLSELIKDDPSVELMEDLLRFAVLGCEGDVCTSPREDNVETVKILLENGAPLDDNILEQACEKKCFDMLEILVENKAKCGGGNTILHFLVKDCPETFHDEIMSVIKKFNIDVNARNDLGETALHKAAESAALKIIKMLMENGADLAIRDSNGKNALHFSSSNSTKRVTKMLLDTGLAVDAQTKEGTTALHFASERGNCKIVKMLLKHGADPNCSDYQGNNALHYASKSEHNTREIIELLQEAGVDLNASNLKGAAPLHLAAETGDSETVKMLLKYGADPTCSDSQGNNALHYASKSEHNTREIIELLQEAGVNLNVSNPEGVAPPLLLAAEAGDTEIVKTLLKYGADLNCSDSQGNNALHYASKSEHNTQEIIELLVEAGLNLNAPNLKGVAPLHLAVETGDIEILNMLLKYRADPNCSDSQGNNALHCASKSKYNTREIIKWLVEAGVNLNASNLEGVAPFHLAAETGDTEIVKMLFKYGADPTCSDSQGNNALHYASKSEHNTREIIKWLVEAGVNLNAPNLKGVAPLHLAAETGDTEIVKMLLKDGADPTCSDSQGNNALHYASKSEHNTREIIELLQEAGVDLNASNLKGAAPLHLAAETGDSETVKMLLKYGADPTCSDSQGNNALHYASKSEHNTQEIIELLVEAGLNLNAPNLKGVAPLHLAVETGDIEILNMLLKYRADPNCSDSQGNNALHYASKSKYNTREIIKWLVEAGVNLNAPNLKGVAPFHLAAETGDTEIVKMLFKYGADPTCSDSQGNNALHYALKSEYNTREIIKWLVDAGVNLNASNLEGVAPLHLAAEAGNTEIVNMLLKYAADPNCSDSQGNNALHYASKSKHNTESMVKLLINKGVEVNARNQEGFTPMHPACERERLKMKHEIGQWKSEGEEVPESKEDGLRGPATTDRGFHFQSNIGTSTKRGFRDAHVDVPERKQNCPGSGLEYECLVPAYFALKLNCTKDVKDFTIRSNVAEFGRFDDIIVDITMENGESLNFAFQLRHSERDREIFASAFESSRGRFSLKRYCTSFQNMSPSLKAKYHYILYTNQKFGGNRRNQLTRFTALEDDQCPGKLFFGTSSDMKNTYKFEVTDNSEEFRAEREFFPKLTLYVGQKSVQGFRKLIFEILKERNAVDSYLDLFRRWHQRLFTNQIIDRTTINTHLVDIYLSPFMITDYRLSAAEYQEAFYFEKITTMFDVIVFADSKENSIVHLTHIKEIDSLLLKIRGDSYFNKYKSQYRMNLESTLKECMLRLAKEYKFVDKAEVGLDERTEYKMFCFLFQHLLMIDFNENSEEAVYNLMEVYQLKEGRIRFVLLGHGVDLSKLSSLEVFHNLDSISKKDAQVYQELTARCKMLLQGRLINLNQLLESFKLSSVVETKEIFEMLTTKYAVGEGKVTLPPGYVSRHVTTTVFDSSTVLHSCKDVQNIIIVASAESLVAQLESLAVKEGIKLVELSEYIANRRSFLGKLVISLTEELNPEKEIETILAEDPGKNIHVFKMIDVNTFVLTKSTSKFTCEGSRPETFSQEEVLSVFEGPLNLLVAEPGMGKSSFVKYLTNECPWSFWTIYVDLRSHSSFFRQARTSEAVLTHFMKTEEEESSFRKKLLDVFKTTKRIVVFLDGLDEVPKDCVENVLEVVDSLSRVGHRVWLSSRPNLEGRLLERFSLFSVRLLEFGEEEQKTFLQPHLKEEEIARLLKPISEGLRSIDNAQFLRVPFHLSIFVEMFRDNIGKSEHFFTATNLYRYFFEGRFNHCLLKYENESHSAFLPSVTEHLQRYEVAALESVLDAESFQGLHIDCRRNVTFLKSIEADKDAVGIIVKVERGKAVFEHPTYAEYFAAVWLKNNPEKEILLKAETSGKYGRLLRMLNTMRDE